MLLSIVIFGLAAGMSAFASDWQKKVPEADRTAQNPLATDSTAPTAGAILYSEKCAKCHGDNAQGKGHHPSLHTEAVQNLTPGELNWVIDHGTGIHGMPSFHSVSETERWQLVSYLKSLGSAGGQAASPK